MRGLATVLLGLVFGAALALIAMRFWGEAPPRAGLSCTPIFALAGEPVSCFDLSLYATRVDWDFGDGQMASGSGQKIHFYDHPGEYTITLTAGNSLHDQKDRAQVTVQVTDPDDISPPIAVSLAIREGAQDSLDEAAQALERVYEIHEIKDDHPYPFDSHTRTFTRLFHADDGHVIDSLRLEMHSSNQLTRLRSRVLEGQKAARLLFALRSGPRSDPYRGWLKGQVVLVQKPERLVQADAIRPLLPYLYLDHYGDYRLPRLPVQEDDWILFLDSEGEALAEGWPHEEMLTEDGSIGFRLLLGEAQAILRVTRRRLGD